MKIKLNSAILILSFFVALFFFGARGLTQQSSLSQASNFTSVEYFEAPRQQQIKTRLSGAEAQPQAGGLLAIKKLKLETFTVDGKPEFIAQAPECVYDTLNETAGSSGHLQLQTGDGKFRVEGDGFLWRQTQSSLIISNQVRTLIIALVAAVNVSTLSAQTNVNAAPPKSREQTQIDSDSANFDMTGHKATYLGHVRVDDPQMKLACAWLVVDLPEAGGRVNHIVAETNVVIDFTDTNGQTNHVTSDKAVYDYSVQNGVTNETVTLTGNAKVENAQGWLTGEPIVWNRANNSLTAINQKMIYRQNFNSMKAETNSPAANTNLPFSKTNLPPGTIENIDRMIIPQGNP